MVTSQAERQFTNKVHNMVTDRRFALIFRSISLALIIAGFLSMMGVFTDSVQPSMLMYYTMQSNMLAIVLFAMLVFRTAIGLRKEKTGSVGYYARFEMICVTNLLLTFFAFWLMLAPRLFPMTDEFSMWSFGNLAVHCITPLLCFIDYILFYKIHNLKYRDVYYSVGIPLFYFAVTSVAGLLGYVYRISAIDGNPIHYPYYFYDYDRIGAKAFLYITVMTGVFILFVHIFYFIDIKRRKKRTSAPHMK